MNLKDFGYEGKEILMNADCGSLGTSEEWLTESVNWPACVDGDLCGDCESCDCLSIECQFSNLTHVVWDEKNYSWKDASELNYKVSKKLLDLSYNIYMQNNV